MFGFLRKLLPPANEEFFTLFEDAAANCKETAQLFCRINNEGINNPSLSGLIATDEEQQINNEGVSNPYLDEARRLKHESGFIVKAILRKLNSTFITPIDREDIQNIANLLNKITKKIVKACFNLHIYNIQEATYNMKLQAFNLLEATEELVPVVRLIRNTSQTEEATKFNNRMKEIESNGDTILNQTMAKLFSDSMQPLDVMKYREIHKDIESALDLCYVVSDEVLSVMLKHS
ncbi:phosphate transport regulator [Planctomycetales bacterium]|nr:phosphate transport regulator [Planctomycetales bacterium]